ncbi:MAG: hypothetical protein CMQ15_14320 [Gammaproteobacteria bacterium]|nr:hypothetical protein [Gammaproteobacteria bacterium]HJN94541.1 hypothetical protein [Gammaproteobacteria bacterium]
MLLPECGYTTEEIYNELGCYRGYWGNCRALGVIATLLFLGLQIRQNARATITATFDAILAEWRQLERNSFIEHPENISVFAEELKDFDNLSLNEQRLFNFVMNQYALFIENMIQQHQHANIQYSQLAPWLNYYSMLIRAPGGSVWWNQYKVVLSRTLTEMMDKHRSENEARPDITAVLPYFFGIDSQQEKGDVVSS